MITFKRYDYLILLNPANKNYLIHKSMKIKVIKNQSCKGKRAKKKQTSKIHPHILTIYKSSFNHEVFRRKIKV